jgi:urate oxidase
LPVIASNTYGKTRVRLTFVDRSRQPNEIRELSVAIFFKGDFSSTYENGDNSRVLPTDTMKNTVYVLARRVRWDSIEVLAQGIAQHFLTRLPHVSQVTVHIEQVPWQPIGHHPSAFTKTDNERRTTRLVATRTAVEIHSGLTGLQILKTADSAFSGFLKDELTTLAETEDRLFGTVLEADWQCLPEADIDFNESHRHIRETLLGTFAEHKSMSVQHTLFAMGEAVLATAPAVAEVHLVMPNKHCLLVDLARFGLDNPNQIFIPTDEPSGYIEARLRR